ncbi:MAG: transcriptional repressor [Ectothiorhodospiraceae bacterium]|nr:transcriptional repressor [Ectothiorhodospiraceae bacterium]
MKGMSSNSLRDLLREAGLRPTRQRLALARLLLSGEPRHVTADELLAEARAHGVAVAQTTVYNILHQFHQAGLIREVLVESGRSWFDTKTTPHMHLYHEDTGRVRDLDQNPLALELLERLDLPEDLEVMGVDVVLRVRSKI